MHGRRKILFEQLRISNNFYVCSFHVENLNIQCCADPLSSWRNANFVEDCYFLIWYNPSDLDL